MSFMLHWGLSTLVKMQTGVQIKKDVLLRGENQLSVDTKSLRIGLSPWGVPFRRLADLGKQGQGGSELDEMRATSGGTGGPHSYHSGMLIMTRVGSDCFFFFCFLGLHP